MASGKATALSGHAKPASVEVDSLRPSARTICAVVVAYHPDSELLNRVERIVPQVGKTLIVDNGSSEPCVHRLKKIANQLDVHLILNPTNEGLARAINQGAQWAASQGYRWIVMLDQDTTVGPDMVETLAGIVRSDPDPERLAVVGSNFKDRVTGRLSTTVARPGEPGATETVTTITSGSLVSLSVFEALGGLRDDFFIDCVDHEYCLRARAQGFRVMITSRPLMDHPIGNFTYHRFLRRTVRTTNHAPVRHYFMARNLLLLIREYATKDPRFIYAYSSGYLRAAIKLCLFEGERRAKIRGIARGLLDGLLRRRGPTMTRRYLHDAKTQLKDTNA